MEHKVPYRFLALALALALFTARLDGTTRSRAFVPLAVPVAWEVLQAVFFAAGMTTVLYLDHLHVQNQIEATERAYQAHLEALDGLDDGLGEALGAEIGQTVADGASYRVSISAGTWARLLAVSQALAATGGGLSVPVEFPVPVASYRDAVRTAAMAIPEAHLPRDRYGYHARSYAVTSSTVEGFTWERFMTAARTYTGMDDPYVTVIYTAQERMVDGRAQGAYCLTYAFTKERVKELQGYRYNNALVLLDGGGNYLDYGYATVAWTPAGYEEGGSWSVTGCRERPTLAVWFTSPNEYAFSTDFDTYPLYTEVLVKNGSIASTFPVEVEGAFRDQLRTGSYDVVTPGRFLTGVGTLAGDVAITIPTTFPLADEIGKVLDGTVPATDVLPKVGVVPVDTTADKVIGKDQAITDAITDAKDPAATAPAVGSFDLSLADFFPFCIPFDFVNFIRVLKAEPEAPSFKFKFPTGFDGNGGGFAYTEYELSLERFDEVAYWFRKFELLAFIVGLAMATRSMFIRS